MRCVYARMREREKERGEEGERERVQRSTRVCAYRNVLLLNVCVRVSERERGRKGGRGRGRGRQGGNVYNSPGHV